MQVRFLADARMDLFECNQYYTELGGSRLAARMLDRIKKPILSLANNPEIAPPCDLAPGIRRLVVAGGAFLVYYRVHTNIEILHIRRAERFPITEKELKNAADPA